MSARKAILSRKSPVVDRLQGTKSVKAFVARLMSRLLQERLDWATQPSEVVPVLTRHPWKDEIESLCCSAVFHSRRLKL